MSSNKDNLTFKKTSFLSGVNSSYIEDYYATYLEDPRLLPYDWQKFFEGLNEDKINISRDIKGPSWSPAKIIKKPAIKYKNNLDTAESTSEINLKSDNRKKYLALTDH